MKFMYFYDFPAIVFIDGLIHSEIYSLAKTPEKVFVYVARFVYPASGSLILNFLNTNMMEMIFFSAFVQSELNLCRTSNIFQ